MSPENIAALRNLVKSLPVTAPLESYEFGSPFGVRGDPMNGHAAYHTGVDLRAPYMTPVYATAAGVVTYSGYRDDYGKVVEIDHGNGISTRYAHLHRQTVSVGQRIAGAYPDRLSRQHRPRHRPACPLRGAGQWRTAGPGEIPGPGPSRYAGAAVARIRRPEARRGGCLRRVFVSPAACVPGEIHIEQYELPGVLRRHEPRARALPLVLDFAA